MTYISPSVQNKFNSLSSNLQNIIMERNVQINSIHDLIRVLEDIVQEAEG
ncbi:hypothetical protein ACTQ6A_08985 [Lachnospiraceae bacterium LCP25S3_G4]